jgi:hypothetical protein
VCLPSKEISHVAQFPRGGFLLATRRSLQGTSEAAHCVSVASFPALLVLSSSQKRGKCSGERVEDERIVTRPHPSLNLERATGRRVNDDPPLVSSLDASALFESGGKQGRAENRDGAQRKTGTERIWGLRQGLALSRQLTRKRSGVWAIIASVLHGGLGPVGRIPGLWRPGDRLQLRPELLQVWTECC